MKINMQEFKIELEEGERIVHHEDYNMYVFTSFGRIYSFYNSRFLKGSADEDGYLRVTLIDKNGKYHRSLRIHSLICELFHGERPSIKHTVQHTDHNVQNNKAGNLCWKTMKEQHDEHWYEEQSKSQRNNEKQACKRVGCSNGNIYPSIAETHRQLPDIPKCSISAVCNGHRQRTHGLSFWFID